MNQEDQQHRDPTLLEFAQERLADFVARAFERMCVPKDGAPHFAELRIRLHDGGYDDDGVLVLDIVVAEEWDATTRPLRRDQPTLNLTNDQVGRVKAWKIKAGMFIPARCQISISNKAGVSAIARFEVPSHREQWSAVTNVSGFGVWCDITTADGHTSRHLSDEPILVLGSDQSDR